jgi:hypothetical protein
MNDLAENAVKIVICASAPEREAELSRMWDEHQPNVNQVDDRNGFTLEAGSFGLVLFDHKTMCQIWLLGFAAQHSFNLYLPYLILSQATGLPFSPADTATEQEAIDIHNEISALYGAKRSTRISSEVKTRPNAKKSGQPDLSLRKNL